MVGVGRFELPFPISCFHPVAGLLTIDTTMAYFHIVRHTQKYMVDLPGVEPGSWKCTLALIQSKTFSQAHIIEGVLIPIFAQFQSLHDCLLFRFAHLADVQPRSSLTRLIARAFATNLHGTRFYQKPGGECVGWVSYTLYTCVTGLPMVGSRHFLNHVP